VGFLTGISQTESCTYIAIQDLLAEHESFAMKASTKSICEQFAKCDIYPSQSQRTLRYPSS
jgi:hypothetical protein